MRTGDLVVVSAHDRCPFLDTTRVVKGYMSYPGEYGFHKSVWVVDKEVGVILDERVEYFRVLFDGKPVWVEKAVVKPTEICKCAACVV